MNNNVLKCKLILKVYRIIIKRLIEWNLFFKWVVNYENSICVIIGLKKNEKKIFYSKINGMLLKLYKN